MGTITSFMRRRDGAFDDETMRIMREAFDAACALLDNIATPSRVTVADRAIDAATSGERDPARLRDMAIDALRPQRAKPLSSTPISPAASVDLYDCVNRHVELGMPRYYFIIEMPDHTYDDSEGEELPSYQAAKDYGRRVVRELKESDFGWASAVLRVRDETGQTIDSIPFWLP